ncbi:unnamed protein product [Cladocopium goreaui]|uniref:Uncharacterized protein n=1 Tax=Cladocopium goreaui TaxID=2562237 RepID=A0A9P1GA86_9DINO|nr:unnamed protein product [Cladocopium goreaui]
MQPRCDGTYLVPQEVLEAYRDLTDGGRERVQKMWAQSSNDKDTFIKSCKRKVQSIHEQDLWLDGNFMSEKDMQDDNISAERIKAIKETCAKTKGWIRRDRYEKHVKVYWVEKGLQGRMLKRRRQVLEEEEDLNESDYQDALKKDTFLPQMQDMEEDDTDPTVVIEADGQDGAKAILKKMTWPLMDDDALPSSYTTRAQQIDVELMKFTDKITGINTQGICNGFKSEDQDDLSDSYDEARTKTKTHAAQVPTLHGNKLAVCQVISRAHPGAPKLSACSREPSHLTRNLVSEPGWVDEVAKLRKMEKDAEKEEMPRTPAPKKAVKAEAPAKALVDQGQALRAELGTCDVGRVLHDSTQSVLHGHETNSSRQFKRAVARFGMAMILI